MDNPEKLAEVRPDRTCELCSRGNHRWNSKGWDPRSEQNMGTFLLHCRPERYCFRPSTRSINNGEQVSISRRLRQGSNYVFMDMRKPSSKNWYRLGRSLDMGLNLAPLTIQAGLRPQVNIFGQTFPNITS